MSKADDINDLTTISAQGRELYANLPEKSQMPASPAIGDLPGWRALRLEIEKIETAKTDELLARYSPEIIKTEMAGIPVLDIRPEAWVDNGKVLLHTHGGAYTLFSAASSLTSSIPMANDSGLRIISIDYTLAPEAKWQAIVEEVIAVIKALQQQGYAMQDMAIFGESAGGSLAAGVTLKLRDEGMGMFAAVIMWSPWSDITESGESYTTLREADPAYYYDRHLQSSANAYADAKDQKHPYVSPVYADYSKGFPPSLIQGGTREIFLSNFVRHYQAIDNAGQIVKLDLYEGMPHVFQALDPEMPESKQARKKVKDFLDRYLIMRE